MESEEQKTIIKKKDKALLAALAVFAIVMAGIGIVGMLLIKAPDSTTQGQADCDAVRVSGKLPGRVEAIYVKAGDTVHKGDTLAKVYSSTVDAKLYQAQAMQQAANSQEQKAERGTRDELKKGAYNVWQQALAAQTIAQKTFTRMQNLYDQGVISEQKRDEARAALDAATAQAQAAKSQYDMAVRGAQQEDKTAARSMANAAHGSDGEVSEIYPQEGELVSIGTPIMSISRLDDMWVSFSVREEKLKDLPMGKEVKVTIPALDNKEVQMEVYYIHDMGSYAVWQATKAYGGYDSKTFEVKMRPKEKVENLRPGMSVLLK